MTALYPQWFQWTGEAMVPLNPKAADRQYVVGERYHLDHREERSTSSHNHEFAWLHEAWLNLPEALSDQFPTPEHLRKRALIECGYYHQEIIDCGTSAAALRVAAFARKTEFARVVVRGPIVGVRTAKSQSRRHMDKQEFAASKTAIMEWVASLIGVPADRLQSERAA